MPGYRVIELWDHEWVSMKKTNPEIREWLAKQNLVEPIQVRDSLYGGRTNPLVLYYKCKADEKINYDDITSLYPYVQKYMRYPVGHPEIITENFKNFNSYFGIAKCKILPPRNLNVPVLPAKINNKLIFTLCYQCALSQNIGYCIHTKNERAITNTWPTPEIQKAVSLGYKILKVYEVYHYAETEQYDPVTKTGGIFTPYIDAALKSKQEASGYPDNVKTEADKDKYIEDYYKHEGVQLEKDNIKKNPGMRTLAKLRLNCLWVTLKCCCLKRKIQY